MARRLTVASVAAAKGVEGKLLEIADAGCSGLYLALNPGGTKSWVYRYRYQGKTKRMTLGKVNVVDAASDNPALGGYLTLGDARRLASEQRHLIDLGRDPIAVEEARKAAVITERTASLPPGVIAPNATPGATSPVEVVIEDYLATAVRGQLRTAAAVERSMNVEVIPFWRGRPVGQIDRSDVLNLLKRHVERGAPVQANRILAYLKTFFEYAVEKGIVKDSPAAAVKKPTRESARDRVLSAPEIAALWAATGKIGYPFGPMAQLLLLTGQRLSEVAEARRGEFDWVAKEWLIPSIRVKNGRNQLVPVTPRMEEIISRLPRISASDLLFTTSGKRPVSGFDKAKRRIDREMGKALFPDAEDGADRIERWTFHDLRRTAATTMARLEVEPHVIEAVLNHTQGKITHLAKVYITYQYKKEKRAALEKLDAEIMRIVGEQQ